ncbi:MAG: MarR family transcriptional regulator [Bacteroidetes bacterium]|nr:MarR family transcriptional regulator [Bacteroidota bacterium]
MNEEFIRHFREILRTFDREVFFQNSASCCNGISMAQCHSLLEIEKNSEISVSELANKLSLDKSTVSRTVDGLVNIKMVDRVIPKENRRKAMINLTESGRDVCKTIHYINDSFISEILSDFTSKEREDFLRLFEKLTCKMVALRVNN